MTGLTELDLTSNQLTYIPEELGEMKSLQVLKLGYNELTVVPLGIMGLRSLQPLILSGNRISEVVKKGIIRGLPGVDIRW